VRRILLSVACVAAIACEPPPRFGGEQLVARVPRPAWRAPPAAASITPEDALPRTPPPLTEALTRDLPVADDMRLPNGVRVFALDRSSLPIVAVRVVIDRTGVQAPPGVASFTASALPWGVSGRTGDSFSKALHQMGATYSVNANREASWIDVRVYSENVRPAIELLTDMLRYPTLTEDHTALARDQWVSGLAASRARPEEIAADELDAMLYPPSHPYHAPFAGDAASQRRISKEDVLAFWRSVAVPSRTSFAVAGKVDRARVLEELTFRLGDWGGAAPESKPLAAVDPPASRRVLLLDHPGDTQCRVLIGWLVSDRSSDQIPALRLLASGLARGLTGRLVNALRLERGVTYGVDARVVLRTGQSEFILSAAIERDYTADAIGKMLAEIDRLRNQPLSEAEMPLARANVAQRTWQGFETLTDAAATMSTATFTGEPLARLFERLQAVRRVSREEMQAVATKYIPSEAATIVVVGDASRVRASLQAAGIGEVTVKPAEVAPPGAGSP